MQNISVQSSGMPRKQNFEISGGRYFQMAKTYTSHGHFKIKIAKNVEGILFEKR